MSWWSKNVTSQVSNLTHKTGFDKGLLNGIFNVNNDHSILGSVGRYFNDFKEWYDGTAAQRKANQMNIANWEMQNAYNTPEAQMARYAAAGLNPNLIYSQQNTAGSIASVSPAMAGGEVLSKAAQTIASFYSIAGMIANVKNLQQQNMNLKSQDSLLGAQADYVAEQAKRYAYDTKWYQDRGIPTSGIGAPAYERMFNWFIDLIKSGGGRLPVGLDNRYSGQSRKNSDNGRYPTMTGEYFPIRY